MIQNKTAGLLAMLVIFAAALPACVSSRVLLNAQPNERRRSPHYVDYFDYYFWGLKAHPTVDLQKVCMDQKPRMAEQIRTVEDGIITGFTLGIYAPMTVRVWCGE